MSENPTLADVIGELSGGTFEKTALEMLKMVALGAVATGKTGKLTMDLELKPVNDTGYVEITHTLKYVKPTRNGKSSEESATKTPMFVDNFGYLTCSQQDQSSWIPNEKGDLMVRSVSPIKGK